MNSRVYHVVQQFTIVGSLLFLTMLFGFIAIFRIICLPFYIIAAFVDGIKSIEIYNQEEDARIDKWTKRLNGK